jgi:class 3 adenylate cyclase/predicted ATPase
MQCPQCQHENPEDARFCNSCGAKLEAVCPACGHVNPPGSRFCNACGHNLAAAPQPEPLAVTQESQPTQVESLPEPTIPDAEQRQLTVMFCDLADSTKLSGQLDPEDLRDVIRDYQETAAGVIQRYEGHIAQYLGDGLLVYFGWPRAHEDDAQRAAHTGLGIIEAMGELNTRLEQGKGVRLTVRIGIHTGPVVIGEMGGGGRHERLALGETTNIAARLEGLAQPNTVVISDTTYRLVTGYFHCDDLGTPALKGVATPMQTYRVQQATEVQGRLDVAITRGLTPLVGRESEVSLLLERWNQAKDGQGQVVLLSGEAGIGKSRLVQVLKDHVADEPHTRLQCRSSPYYQNTALYPITDLLRRTLQWQPDDALETKLEKLEQVLQPYRLSLHESVPIFASLLSLRLPEDRYAALDLTPQQQRQKTLETIVAVLLQAAERHTLLFILEDLHWTDPSTLEVLDQLIEQAPTATMLVILTCRPEFAPPWGLRTHLTPIALNRFTRSQIEAMVARLTGGKTLPAEVMQHLVEKTDGVPLYVEEMTKAILEAGVLEDADGYYELIGPVASLAIPTTLQDSLIARLDRLQTAKGVAQLGATIGRQFSYEMLQALWPAEEAILQQELGRLVAAELVYQRGIGLQAMYTFKHALIQDAAYQSLLRRTRQQHHQRIVQVLSERFREEAETQPELLAHHCTEAGLTEQAVAYWHQAGQRAIQRSAHVEAISHLRQGLELLNTLPETPARNERELLLLMTLGPAVQATKGGAAPEVEHVYSRAQALCQQVEDSPQLFSVLVGLRRFYVLRGELRTARELGEQVVRLATQQHDPAVRVEAHRSLGHTLFFLGEFVTARHHFEQGIMLCESQPHASHAIPDAGMVCLCFVARVLWMLGYAAQGLRRVQEAVVLARSLSQPFNLVYALLNTAMIHYFRREHQAAEEAAETTVTISTEHGFVHYIAMGKIMQGWALSAQSRKEGLPLLRQGLTAYQATGARLGLAVQLSWLAEAYGHGGQVAEGLAVMTQALDMVEGTDEGWWTAELYRLKGEFLLSSAPDNQPEAESCFYQALSIAQNQSAKSWELRAATSLARLWQQQGKRQDAYDLLAPVYAWFTEGFDTADLQEAKSLLAGLSS